MDILIAISQLIAASIRLASPIAYAAIGGCYSERSGVTAMGLEGMMLSGAFFAVLGSSITGSPWGGVIFACLGGAAAALIHALFSIRFKANQVVCGLGVNMLSAAVTTVLLGIIWGNKGKSEVVPGFKALEIPVLSKIPVLGGIASQDILIYILYGIILLSWVVLFKTPIGMRIRATGEHPKAVDSLGLDACGIRFWCVILSGVLSGLGGACLSIGQLSFFSQSMTNGKGFIAIAAFVFGRWNPVAAAGVALLFGFMDALQLRLQAVVQYTQLIQMIPYILTIVVISSKLSKTAVSPAAVGEPYYTPRNSIIRRRNETKSM